MKTHNIVRRSESLQGLKKQVYDLVIVGGGITGAGVARDAALRGLKVLVLEQSDFASGTSSRSSKLAHGGVRYLENLEFGLVFEALSERQTLFKSAPNLVRPLRFLIPIYKNSRVGKWKMSMGMWLYDLLSLFRSPELHENLSAKSVLKVEPQIKSEGLVGGFLYSDGFMDDDLLVIDTLKSAMDEGAETLSYARVTGFKEHSEECEISFKDLLGEAGDCTVKTRHVVSCTGPWTEKFSKQILKDEKCALRPTKGVHIVFPSEKLPVKQAVVMAVEKRIIFVIPRGRSVIVGTTDTDFLEDPSDVRVSKDDISYLVSALNNYFPKLELSYTDIISCYAGVRPLVKDASSSEGKTSREHQIFDVSDRVTSIAGGKYTTFRSMSEELVKHIIKKMGGSWPSRKSTKESLFKEVTESNFEQAQGKALEWSKKYSLDEKRVSDLLARYGTAAEEILKSMEAMGKYSSEECYWRARAKYSISNEMCFRLEDFFLRRTYLYLFEKKNGAAFVQAISDVFRQELGWTAEEQQEEEQRLKERIDSELQALNELKQHHS